MVDIIPGLGGAGPNILETALGAMPQASIEPFEGLPGVVSIRETSNGKMRFEDLERFAAAPRRTRQRVEMENVEGFVRYVTEFARPKRTQVFATNYCGGDYRIEALIDYHGTAENEASWIDHAAGYSPQFAPGFAEWRAKHGVGITQAQFAEFLEDRAADAVVPDPAHLMEVATNFSPVNGECPKIILLRCPIFQGTPTIDFSVRIAYTLDEGKLVLVLKIHRLVETIEAAFDALCDEIRDGLGDGIPVYRGRAFVRDLT